MKKQGLVIGRYNNSSLANVFFNGKLVGHVEKLFLHNWTPRYGLKAKPDGWIFTPIDGNSIRFPQFYGVDYRNRTLTKLFSTAI